MFAVQQGSKSDTSKERQPAPLPSVSTPLNIEGSITFFSFLSTQPFIVNATEITFNFLVQKFLPCLQFQCILSFLCKPGMCFPGDNSLHPSIWPKSCAKYFYHLFGYFFFSPFFEILQNVDFSRS